jgi:hypothetical protein
MDQMARQAVPHMKAAMGKTKSQPAIETDTMHLVAEKHSAGAYSLYMVINAHDRLPEIPEKERHWLYNYAPLEATFTLKGIPPGCVVHCFEGQDWSKVREVRDYDRPQKAAFEPGEMKLYLVGPRSSKLDRVSTSRSHHGIRVQAVAGGPCPLTVRIIDPAGKEVCKVFRTPDGGMYDEVFPIGYLAPLGKYRVEVESPIERVSLKTTVDFSPPQTTPFLRQTETVQVHDSEPIRSLLASRASLVIAHGEGHRDAAGKLAADLARVGVKAVARPERDMLRKVPYPRVWNPFATIYSPTGPEKKPEKVKLAITLGVSKDGKLTAQTADGKDVSADWRQPNSVISISGEGFVDFSGDREICYEPGVKLHVSEGRQVTVIRGVAREVKTTAEFRTRWAKPWDRLTTHVGGYQYPAQLPEAWTTDSHLIVLGDSKASEIVAALQASELLPRLVDSRYPGPGKALIQFAWSPFALEKNVIYLGASDAAGLTAAASRLIDLARK